MGDHMGLETCSLRSSTRSMCLVSMSAVQREFKTNRCNKTWKALKSWRICKTKSNKVFFYLTSIPNIYILLEDSWDTGSSFILIIQDILFKYQPLTSISTAIIHPSTNHKMLVTFIFKGMQLYYIPHWASAVLEKIKVNEMCPGIENFEKIHCILSIPIW